MDNIADPDIWFDENGVSSYYYDYHKRAEQRIFKSNPNELHSILEKVKASGRGLDYDCIIGVSGGVDSSYVAYLTKQWGLRPLAVHFDNGWNSELSVKNIEKLLNTLGIDLYTYVIDWEEFRKLQLAFLRASTPDGEIPTDHAILALLYQVASEKKIKYIISGNNVATEGVLPQTWAYGHIDWKYIRTINKRFGGGSLKNYPHITLAKYLYYTFVKGIQMVSILNYVDYNKEQAMQTLQNELGWKYYGGKHYESIYTRFYQGYVLPEKFNIDKRKAHLSALIFSGQLTKEEALNELKKPIYPGDLLSQDMQFLQKKLGLSESQFAEIMALPPKTFKDYPNSYEFQKYLRKALALLRRKRIFYS